MYGCCSDGVTPALGPDDEGCPRNCEGDECCEDGRTPRTLANISAPGNVSSCGCVGSLHGCCYDGVTPAQAPGFQGCDHGPGEECLMSRDGGAGGDWSVMWYYDTDLGECGQFWYAGTMGNNNRFLNKESCNNRCVNPPGSARCYLPK